MTAPSDRPSPRQAIRNLRQPMPLGTKFSLYIRNVWRRAIHRSNCCGHPGEPGC